MLCVLPVVHYVCESRRAPDAVILHLACLKSLYFLKINSVCAAHPPVRRAHTVHTCKINILVLYNYN